MKPDRLDVHLAKLHPYLSRATITKLIKSSQVEVNGAAQIKPSYSVRPKDKIKLKYVEKKASQLDQLNLPIIYQDDDVIVINKPLGTLSHTKGPLSEEATVASWLRDKTTGLPGNRGGIVHRLDRATSGVMIAAKNEAAQLWLQKQFSLRRNKKIYLAIVSGMPKDREAIIDLPIERNPKKPQTFRVGAQGKAAITRYRVLSSKGDYSLVELSPKTGRTHQLRVHMAYIGHPILGDELYGGSRAERMYLHAYSLEITLPSKERKIFKVDLPKEFNKYIANGYSYS